MTLVAHVQVSAQRKAGALSGTVVDSVGRNPLVGAYVSVTSSQDTLHTSTNIDGAFTFGRLRDSVMLLKITYLGFSELTREIRLKPGINRLDTLTMSENSVDVDAVVVRANRPMMSRRGDTIVYHPENIRVLPGDEIMQVVMRLPGMEVKDGNIKFMGKSIERTYVDGRPLFGENAQAALDYMAAKEVVDIQVYEEIPEEEQIKGDENAKKRTVLNLITRSKPEKSINVEMLASYGADIDEDAEGKHRARYGAGASYQYFSERRIDMLNVNSNNNGQNQNRMRDLLNAYSGSQGDRKNTAANLNLTRRFGENLMLTGNYSYNNDFSRTQNISEQIYFPTDLYDSRVYRDTTRRSNRMQSHSADLSVRYNTKSDYFFFAPNVRFSNSTGDSYRGASNVLDGETVNRVSANDRNKGLSRNLSGNLTWGHSFKNKPRRSFNLSMRGASSENDDKGWRVDSLASDQGRTFLETTGNGWNNSFGGGVSYSEPIGEKNYMSARYNVSYENSKSTRIAVDRFTGQIDTTLTYDYTRNYTTHNSGLDFSRNTEHCHLSFGLGYQSSRLNKDEAFPELRADRHIFQSLLPTASFNYHDGPGKSLYFNYSTSSGQPSVEQLRNELNNMNRLSLTGGNPNLRQSYMHSISVGLYNTNTETSRTIGFSLGAGVTANEIANQRIFFTQDTPLPDYNGYIAPKGSTLTLPVNVNGAGNVYFNANFSTPVKFLGMTFSANAGCRYNRRPNYIEDVLDYTNSISPNVGFGIHSNKSTVVQFYLYSQTSFDHGSNSLRDDNNTISEQVSVNVTLNFLKHCYFNTNFSSSIFHNFSYAGGNVNTNMLSLSVGCKLMKERQLNIGLQVYDLLNSMQNFTSGMLSDYISNNWTQTYGRYFSIAVGYRFNKIGPIRKKN